MTFNKQLINIVGILLVVVILVAGVAFIAFPMFSQAQATQVQTANVAQTNSVYQVQIDALAAAEAESEQLDASLASLRLQIAATPKLDDVYEIVDAAAKQADVRVQDITADAAGPWVARTAVDAAGNQVEPTPAPTEDAAAADSAAGDAESTVAAADPPAAAPADSADSPQQQVTLTITIDMTLPYAVVDDAGVEAGADTVETEPDAAAVRAAVTEASAKAAAFVDALGVGPRLLSPVNVAYVDGKLTLSTLAFIRTED